MKLRYFYTILLISSCNLKIEENIDTSIKDSAQIAKQDSVKWNQEKIKNYRRHINEINDSLEKYHLTYANDLCIKTAYLFCYDDTLCKEVNIFSKKKIVMSETSIKATSFEKIANSIFRIRYSVFLDDSLPVLGKLKNNSDGLFFHTFDFDSSSKQITKAYLGGRETYVKGKDIREYYSETLQSNQFKEFILSHKNNINPKFLALLNQ